MRRLRCDRRAGLTRAAHPRLPGQAYSLAMDARWPWALGGAATAALALAAGELSGAVLGAGSPIAAIGSLVIELQPPGGKDLMVALFGDNDKLALEGATGVGALFVGALLGLVGRLSFRLALLGFGAFAMLAAVAIARDPLAGTPVALVVAAASLAVATVALPWLLPRPGSVAPDDSRPSPASTGNSATAPARPVDRRRRSCLRLPSRCRRCPPGPSWPSRAYHRSSCRPASSTASTPA